MRGQASSAAKLDETFWALQDVSFEIKRGEVVDIIGRNGAGKSTLLKILSRITEPTQGYADIYGRVGSLLEVGTGFHHELTGRENIYLNGAILGMKKREIARKFDGIIAFAEVERFIDTPVKHYSSGMYLRLAFAVAAYLEPEILLVDEVLAVGDARFQRKCLNKMQDVGQHGRTVLFVSHNMPAITRLCKRVILLDGGRVLEDGPPYHVVKTYLNSGLGTSAAREWSDLSKAPGNDVMRLRAVRVRTEDGVIADALDIRQPFGIDIEYQELRNSECFSFLGGRAARRACKGCLYCLSSPWYACNGGARGSKRAACTERCMCPPSVVNEGAMAYNDFTLDILIAQFLLQVQEESNYFTPFAPLPISDLLRQTLQENVPLALDISTEKARSEFIIAPVLSEVRRQLDYRISLFSGVEFNVNPEQGLRGVCDFLLSLSPLQLTIQAPVVMVVEAKNENVKQGISQCIAEMLAAQQFNQERNNAIETVYGVVTTGSAWKFLRLTGTYVTVDATEYHISQVERVVGILVAMIKEAGGV